MHLLYSVLSTWLKRFISFKRAKSYSVRWFWCTYWTNVIIFFLGTITVVNEVQITIIVENSSFFLILLDTGSQLVYFLLEFFLYFLSMCSIWKIIILTILYSCLRSTTECRCFIFIGKTFIIYSWLACREIWSWFRRPVLLRWSSLVTIIIC